jgi:hypothetical protein
LDTLEDALRGNTVPLEASLMKIVFTAISLGVGGSGGIITPVFFIGATAGSAVGTVLGVDRAMVAAIGMVSLLAAAANAPIASAIMAIELFGPAVGPYAALSAVVSFLIVGHRSVYGSQLLGIVKSGTLVGRGEWRSSVSRRWPRAIVHRVAVRFCARSVPAGGRAPVRRPPRLRPIPQDRSEPTRTSRRQASARRCDLRAGELIVASGGFVAEPYQRDELRRSGTDHFGLAGTGHRHDPARGRCQERSDHLLHVALLRIDSATPAKNVPARWVGLTSLGVLPSPA